MTSQPRSLISPLAKRLAKEKGIDPKSLKGSGPKGRIVKRDLEGGATGHTSSASFTKASIPTTPGKVEKVKHSGMRKVIAKRLTDSKQTIPHFYLTVDFQINSLLEIRQQINQESEAKKKGYKLSVNDFVIKASALALKEVPDANVSWEEDHMNVYTDVDISVAVSIPGGLITPIVKHADLKPLPQISLEMKDLATRARDGKLKPEEYQGGSFSISNLGMYGIKQFNAIINPPQACILAVGAGEQRAIVKEGKIEIADMMTITLSVDHRAIDGSVAAQYIVALKKFIENPALLLI